MAQRTATVHLRISEDERAALERLVAVTGLPLSAIARAGLRLIIARPGELVDERALQALLAEGRGPPPPPRRRGKRKR